MTGRRPDEKPTDECEQPSATRRGVLGRLGVAAGVGLAGLPAFSGAARASGPVHAPEEFSVSGTKTVRTKFTPDAVVTTTKKRSPDLKQRYGITPPVLTKTETLYERTDPAADPYPRRKTVTKQYPWNTYYAKADEWRAFFEGVRARSDHPPTEENNPYGIWEYDSDGSGGFDVAGPMNVISPSSIPDVASVLDSNGWTLAVVQHDRWAWNSATNQFETQHKSAATGTFGVLGRKHMRMWEFEGYVTGSAHVDDAFVHEAISFDDAEEAVENVFDDASGWFGFEDFYDLDNEGHLDHDGMATGLFRS